MSRKKIMLVFGTRPEAIKMAPLVKTLNSDKRFETIVTVTGQHREMLDQVLEIFNIKPDYDLNIMKSGQDLYTVTSNVLLGIRDVLRNTQPDIVLVHGDTSTSTAAALAAFYAQIPVGHVEAGLRTHNIYSPWPEEMNRQLTGRIASLHFAPTQLSHDNLTAEGVSEKSICVTGNTVIDALHIVHNRITTDSDLRANIDNEILQFGYNTKRIEKASRKLILITGHRRENFGEGFTSICKAIKTLASKFPEVDFVYPMHLNPNVRRPIHEMFGEGLHSTQSNIFFIEPLDYVQFIHLMSLASIVLTDSGGIQEEAPGLGKPVLVMRNTTERPEAVVSGTVKLVGTDYDTIVNNCSLLLTDDNAYNKMARANNPYGDGHASERIIEFLNNNL